MRALIDAIMILLLIKGFFYFFFPVFTQRMIVETIQECPPTRLKFFGLFLLFLVVALFIFAQKYFPYA